MDTLLTTLVVITGLLIRLAIPIFITTLLIVLLRSLDAHWQKQAQAPALLMQKPECWKEQGCTPEQRAHCLGAQSPLPCWQAFRAPNGYLQEKCLTCKVFTEAPIPLLKIEPRRM